jgi:hypothetical protein
MNSNNANLDLEANITITENPAVGISVQNSEVAAHDRNNEFDVCGSVHLGKICFIRIQLDVQYSFFLQSF